MNIPTYYERDMTHQERLENIYYSIKTKISSEIGSEHTIESFFNKYTLVCFYEHSFYFTTEQLVPRVSHQGLWHVKIPQIGLSLLNPESAKKYNKQNQYYNIRTFKMLFPFIDFKKSSSRIWSSSWIPSHKILETLPTRANFITKILADLQ